MNAHQRRILRVSFGHYLARNPSLLELFPEKTRRILTCYYPQDYKNAHLSVEQVAALYCITKNSLYGTLRSNVPRILAKIDVATLAPEMYAPIRALYDERLEDIERARRMDRKRVPDEEGKEADSIRSAQPSDTSLKPNELSTVKLLRLKHSRKGVRQSLVSIFYASGLGRNRFDTLWKQVKDGKL